MDKYPRATIGELCRIEKGQTGIASSEPGEYPLVTTALGRKSSKTYQFDTKAVCIPLVSSTGHGKKTLNYVHYQEGKFAVGTILAAVIPNDPRKVSAAFLHRYLQFYKDRKIVPLMRGAANVSLAVKDIAKIEIPVPPVNEQRAFIELFNKANYFNDQLLDEFNSQSNYLSQLRQSILQEAIEGNLTADWRKEHPLKKGDPNTDASALLDKIKAEKQKLIAAGNLKKEKSLAPIKLEEAPFELPDGWVWCRLGEVASIVRGGSPRPAGDKRYYVGDIPFLKVADLTKDQNIYLDAHTYTIKEAGLHKTRFVDSNTLMLTNSGATLGIPKICRFPTAFNDGIAAFLGLIDTFNKEFLYYFLRAKSQWFLDEAARGQGQPNLNTDIIGNTILALPPLAEQQAIVERVDRLLGMVDELQRQVKARQTQAEQLMQSVLREAFEQN
jgi:type I restriction enzyme S subunit